MQGVKSKEIPTEQWVERVKGLQAYQGEDWFSVVDITKNFHGLTGGDNKREQEGTAYRVLRKMVDTGLLEQKKVIKGSRIYVRYRKRKSDTDWLRAKWRQDESVYEDILRASQEAW